MIFRMNTTQKVFSGFWLMYSFNISQGSGSLILVEQFAGAIIWVAPNQTVISALCEVWYTASLYSKV